MTLNWSIISNEKLINGTNKHVKNDALMFNRKKIERSRELSSNECNERVNTHLFASTSLWANNVSWNTWSHPCVFLLLCTQTCAYMGKIPRKFALAIVNRCPAKKRGQPLLINFLVAKIFPWSHIHESSSVWVSPSFFTGKFRDEVYEKLRPPNGKSASLPFFLFSFVKMLEKGKRKEERISTSRQIKMNSKITRILHRLRPNY